MAYLDVAKVKKKIHGVRSTDISKDNKYSLAKAVFHSQSRDLVSNVSRNKLP